VNAIVRVNNDLDYKVYRQGRKILPKVRDILRATGVDLSREGWIFEYRPFNATCRIIGYYYIRFCVATASCLTAR
jgi:hypothetical protein